MTALSSSWLPFAFLPYFFHGKQTCTRGNLVICLVQQQQKSHYKLTIFYYSFLKSKARNCIVWKIQNALGTVRPCIRNLVFWQERKKYNHNDIVIVNLFVFRRLEMKLLISLIPVTFSNHVIVGLFLWKSKNENIFWGGNLLELALLLSWGTKFIVVSSSFLYNDDKLNN